MWQVNIEDMSPLEFSTHTLGGGTGTDGRGLSQGWSLCFMFLSQGLKSVFHVQHQKGTGTVLSRSSFVTLQSADIFLMWSDPGVTLNWPYGSCQLPYPAYVWMGLPPLAHFWCLPPHLFPPRCWGWSPASHAFWASPLPLSYIPSPLSPLAFSGACTPSHVRRHGMNDRMQACVVPLPMAMRPCGQPCLPHL
jgi:hypothetical protein